MGGLREAMPTTFITYAVGMMALAGVPVFFSGFWSKDEILHVSLEWPISKVPFLLGIFGAFLTAFYMTRQMIYVFFGKSRLEKPAHESPSVMTTPLVVLAACAVLIGFLGTPAWPWLHSYMTSQEGHGGIGSLFAPAFLGLAMLSTLVVGAGIACGWYLYQRIPTERDPLETRFPELFVALRERFWIDEV